MRPGIIGFEEVGIEGVRLVRIKAHADDRGCLIEIMRRDDEYFVEFGQVYLSVCYPGVVKAWHAHTRQTDFLFFVKGNAKIGLYDGREDSPTYKKTAAVVAGEANPVLVQIPPLVWHGYTALGGEVCYLINTPTEPYNHKKPDELRVDPFDNDFGFVWEVKSR